jgi:peroxiredoxin
MPIGNTVPPLALYDTEGNLHNLGALQGEVTLLVFWSSDCGYCQMMAADLNAIAANLPARIAKILVISRGSREANLELNLQAPILLDEEMKAMSLFGAMGTPSAVIIDAYGRLASSVAIGASEIFSLLGVKRETSASSAKAEQKI